MRDALHIFGTITLATKDTDVYSEDTIDLDTIDARFRLGQYQTGTAEDLVCVFQSPADLVAADGFIPFIQDDVDETWADPVKIVTGEEITEPLAGERIVVPVPKSHRRHLRAGVTPKSTGVLTASTVEAWLEFGVNPDRPV